MKNEHETLKHISEMCEESLNPEAFEKWCEVKEHLIKNRFELKGESDRFYTTCNGCGIGLDEPEISYTNTDGDDYCNDCNSAIHDDPESLAGLKDD